nr:GNAT family N-acetyltransferase [Paenibacillus farraposensis]
MALNQENITNHDCYVLEVDGVIQVITDLPFVMWFAVDPATHGKGYGRKLLNWVEQTIIRDQAGAPAVTLATAEKYPYLLSMYERWGYERIHAFDHGTGDGTMHLLRKVVNPEPGRFDGYTGRSLHSEW